MRILFMYGCIILAASVICLAQQPFVFIEGTVRTPVGQPLAGVKMSFSNATAITTNELGHYWQVVPTGFSGIVTPSLLGYKFSDASHAYTNLSQNQLVQDFVGSNLPSGGFVVSGTIR